MKNKKSILHDCLLIGLAAIFCGGFALCIPAAFGRYRTDAFEQMLVENARPDMLALQTWAYNETQTAVVLAGMETEGVLDEDRNILNLAIANAQSEIAFEEQNDLCVSLRVITSIGAVQNGVPVPVKLKVYHGDPIDSDNYSVVEGKPTRIAEGTSLYIRFGEGWEYLFEYEGAAWEGAMDGSRYSVIYAQIETECKDTDYPAMFRIQADAVIKAD